MFGKINDDEVRKLFHHLLTTQCFELADGTQNRTESMVDHE